MPHGIGFGRFFVPIYKIFYRSICPSVLRKLNNWMILFCQGQSMARANLNKNPSISDILRWVAGTMGQMNR